MREAYETIQSLGAEIVAISAETLETVQSAAIGARLPFPVLSDASLTAIDRYGVRHEHEPQGKRIARPAIFIIDRQGLVRYAHVGEHPRDRPALGSLLLALESLA